MRRRGLLLLAAAVAGAMAVPQLLRRARGLPEREAIPGLPGFDRLQTGPVTPAGGTALIGLERSPAPDPALLARLRGDPAAALYGHVPHGALPMAIFTDVNCGNCREMAGIFDDLARRPGMHVVWHELPLLGPTSVLAARAVLAAAEQTDDRGLQDRLMRGRLRPSASGLRRLAEEAGLDGDRLLLDMQSPRVDARLDASAALAWLMGIPGTPAMVIDRTLVIGALDRATLTRLLRRAG